MRTLPVLAAFTHSVKSTLNNLPFAFYVSWPWMLLSFPFHAAAAIYITTTFPDYDPGKPDPAIAFKILSVQLPVAILALLSSASIAVSWHRFILKDEVPQGWQRLRLDETVLRYFGNFFLLGFMLAGIALAPSILVSLITAYTHPYAVVLMVPILAAIVVLGVRYSVKFPAIAMNLPNFKFRDAREATLGNNWQLLGFAILTSLPGIAIGFTIYVVSKLLGYFTGELSAIVLLAAQFLLNWIVTIFSVTVLTSLYGYFIEERAF